jgi:hypothetical protein
MAANLITALCGRETTPGLIPARSGAPFDACIASFIWSLAAARAAGGE